MGLASSLLARFNDSREAVTHVAVAFDHPIRSFRNDLFAGYKTEEGMAPERLAQLGEAEHAARALGLTVWPMDRFEADDALATAARRFSGEVERVRILTPDKDLGQCLDGGRVAQVDRVRDLVIDEGVGSFNPSFGSEDVPHGDTRLQVQSWIRPLVPVAWRPGAWQGRSRGPADRVRASHSPGR